jgi:hypothetical protein
MKQMILIILLAILSLPVLAQGEIDKETKIIFRNERTVGFSLNSNGFGFGFRYGKFIDGYRKWLIQSDLNLVKHYKEIQSNSLFYNKKFVYGKINTMLDLRLALGYQKELYSKSDKGGVAIRYFGFVGPSLAILKPMFYEVNYYFEENKIEDFETFYNNTIMSHGGEIIGKSSFFDGAENTTVKPGIHLSGGLSFEYGTKDAFINALELGIAFDIFADDIPIMFSESDNYQQLFTTLFLTYRFGKVINTRAINNNNRN